MTIERSIIRLIIPTESSPAIEPYLEIFWYGRHPGDRAESTILSYIKSKRSIEEDNFSHFLTIEGELVFIYWNQNINAGTALLLDVLAILLWSHYVWHFHSLNPANWDDFFESYNNLTFDESTPTHEKIIDPSWLQKSLEGGSIEFKSDNREVFVNGIRQFLETFPWSSFLIKSGSISGNITELSFISGDISQEVPYSEIFISLAGESQDEFWELITKSIILMVNLPSEQRLASIRESLAVIHVVTNKNLELKERLLGLNTHLSYILKFDTDFSLNYISQVLTEVSSVSPDYDNAKMLLDTAESLFTENLIELAKLTEGTALQIAFSLGSSDEKGEIILELVNRSKIWGTDHLSGFINSLTGILSETDEDKKLLEKIADSCSDLLIESWDGLLCLVQTNLILGKVMKAIELRYSAVKKSGDPYLQAEDTFNASIWALGLDGYDEESFSQLTLKQFEDVIIHFPEGEIFQNMVKNFVNSCIENRKFGVLDNFIQWFEVNLNSIAITDRLPLLQMMYDIISEKVELIKLKVPVVLLLFAQLLEENKPENFELADNLLRSIYNLIDPNEEDYKELISQITSSLVISSSKYGEWELIEEARKRFTLMVNDEEFSRSTMLKIFISGGNERMKLDKSQLESNDIGLRLYEIAIDLSFFESDAEIVVAFLPNAKKLALEILSIDKFINFSALESQLRKSMSVPWIDTMVTSAKELLERMHLEGANYLFSEALKFDLYNEEEYDLLFNQVALVEVEPDFITADEIFSKRNRLIEISTSNEGIAEVPEILDHYRNGVSELILKGDEIHLNDFLLNAIAFSIEKQLTAIEEFRNILLDTFLSTIGNYETTRSQEIYLELIKTFRKVITTFQSKSIDLVMRMANKLIQTNVKLADQTNAILYLRRAQLIANEIGFVIKHASNENIALDIEEKSQLDQEYQKLIKLLKKYNPSFGLIDLVLYSTSYYYNTNDDTKMFNLLDNTLANLKKRAVRIKSFNSGLLLGLILISEVFNELEGEIRDDISLALQEKAMKIVDVISTFKFENKELHDLFSSFRRKLISSPRQALQEFSFSIENYIMYIK